VVVRLCDLGERRILDEIIPKFANGVGSDCAVFNLESSYLAVSTDPVPRPAASAIAGDDDLFWMGWLLVTINASDIAASGANPHSFFASLDLPREMEVSQLERLLGGIRAACDRHGFVYAGGNLREAATVSAVGTALGLASSECLTRYGAQAGSYVVVVGESGRFLV
jgi:thiamine-monophosphate kinase